MRGIDAMHRYALKKKWFIAVTGWMVCATAVAVLVTSLVISHAATASVSLSSGSWPQYMYDVTHQGNNPNDMMWGGITVANGKAYIGVASLCDNPLTQGMLYALNTTTGNVDAQFAVVPDGTVGGGIWSTPTVDAATGTVIVTTGSIEKNPP